MADHTYPGEAAVAAYIGRYSTAVSSQLTLVADHFLQKTLVWV